LEVVNTDSGGDDQIRVKDLKIIKADDEEQ